ncbi:MAG: serine O-acetyltransferase [Chloroflexi bacterium]|nr:serine O-acetyltransferase [Chloroflexota bacterium]
MCTHVREDIRTVFHRDPAARSRLEVLLCYPGLHALWAHRVAHFFWSHRLRLVGRLISHTTRFFTGIEIHPGAEIGRRFFIDHGMAVVIGETTEIGDDCLLYQGVVLGGTTLEKKKRHPTLGNNVVVGSAAILLGPITLGDGSRVGANSVVVKSVPPGVTVVGVPAHPVGAEGEPVAALEHGKLPDPVYEAIRLLFMEKDILAERVRRLEKTAGVECPATEVTEEIKRIEVIFEERDNPWIKT